MMFKKEIQKGEGYMPLDGHTVRKILPQSYPFILLDRVEAYYTQEKRLIGIKNVSQNDLFLQGHFPEYPIFPGVLTIESLTQACGVLYYLDCLMENKGPEEKESEVFSDMLYYLTENKGLEEKESEVTSRFTFPTPVLADSKIKHVGPVYPGDQMKLEAQLTLKRGEMATFKACAFVNDVEVAKGQITLARFPFKRIATDQIP